MRAGSDFIIGLMPENVIELITNDGSAKASRWFDAKGSDLRVLLQGSATHR
jgi:hypothetical protein